MIVLEDADLDRAVQGAVIGVRFTRQGQSCTCASRIFVACPCMTRSSTAESKSGCD